MTFFPSNLGMAPPSRRRPTESDCAHPAGRKESVKKRLRGGPATDREDVPSWTALHEHLRDSSSYRLLWTLWGGLAVIDVGQLLGMDAAVLVCAVAVWVAGCCVRADAWTALAAAAVGWLIVDGFVVNGLGTLRFVGLGDVLRAGILLGAALVGTRFGR
jgi:hypothetical protein